MEVTQYLVQSLL